MNLAHMLPMLAFLILPTIAAIYNYFTVRKIPSTLHINAIATIVNAAVLYALAYNVIFFLQELFLVLGKNWIGLKAVLYHNNHNWFEDHPKDALMQGSGAAAIFIFGIIFLLLQRFLKKDSWIRVFILLLSFQGLMQSLPQFATAMSTPDTDTGQAFYYLNFSHAMQWIITIGSYILMIVTLVYFGRQFLQFSPNNDSAKNRFIYARNFIFLGTLLGVILIIPFRIPPTDRIMAVVFLALITIPIMMAFSWKRAAIKSFDNIINQKILILPIIALVVLLLIFQLVLAPGIMFYP